MKKATKITVKRAEGPVHLCVTKVFEGDDCWLHAKQWLWSSAFSFPREGGYDKHDVTIEFEDGETYEARLDCKHFTCDDPDLDVARHVRRHLEFTSGAWCPPHLTVEQYEGYLRRLGDEHAQASKRFLEEYQIPA